jgi:hypothetical protein
MTRLGLAVTLVGFVLSYEPNSAAGQDAVSSPTYKDGDTWVFRASGGSENDGENEIICKNGKFESLSGRLLESPVFPTVHVAESDRKWFNFPLTKGKKRSFRFFHTSAVTGRREWRDSVAEVIGPPAQAIETPAGKFNAIEIRRTDTARAQFNLIYFYGPETRSVVKLVADVERPDGKSRFEMELIKFSLR